MLAANRAICIIFALHFVLHANKMHYGICNNVWVPPIKIVIVENSCENGKFASFPGGQPAFHPPSKLILCNEVQLIYLWTLVFVLDGQTKYAQRRKLPLRKMLARHVENAFGNVHLPMLTGPLTHRPKDPDSAELTGLSHCYLQCLAIQKLSQPKVY